MLDTASTTWFGFASRYDENAAATVATGPFSLGGETIMLRRHEVTDDQWNRIQHLLPGQEGDPGVRPRTIACL